MPSKTKKSGNTTEEAAVSGAMPDTASDPILSNTNEGVETPFEAPVGADSIAVDDLVTEAAIEDGPSMVTNIPDIPDEYDMDQYGADRPKGTNRYLGIEQIPDIPERVDH